MKKNLNVDKLAEMIKSKRGNKGLRETAVEIGEVSASTLSRIEQSKLPDINTFIKLCDWLEVSPDYFKDSSTPKSKSNEKEIIAHLRADKNLNSNTANTLIKMIEFAYKSEVKNK
ncbi:MAG: helix-turn-helix transcriptional regulator [Ignavibacterium sp.]|jgi:transcriptional regulator with XRE-family HTH domain|nr:helix-turn-helix transcriptional regulator [Ignavibacterium sp.]